MKVGNKSIITMAKYFPQIEDAFSRAIAQASTVSLLK